MKNWIKSYWSNCLSIAAIICSVVAICVSLPSAPELGIDYIGVIVGILSLLVTMLIGWQIWNTIAIEKKIKAETKTVSKSFDKEIKDINNRSTDALQKILYKAELIELRLHLSKNEYESAIESLKLLFYYATLINDPTAFSYMANTIIKCKHKTDLIIYTNEERIKRNNVFLELSQNILEYLPASNHNVAALLNMIKEIKKHNEEIRKYQEEQEYSNDD